MRAPLDWVVLAAIVVGLAQCLFGYRIFRVLLAITGFILGGLLAGYFVYDLTQSAALGVVAGLVGGLLGGALLAGLYFLGVFVIGAIFGAVAPLALFALLGGSAPTWVVVLLALIGGVLAVLVQKLMIILATSFGGAWWAVTGIAAAARAVELAELRAFPTGLAAAGPGWLIGWFVLGLAGVLIQYRQRR